MKKHKYHDIALAAGGAHYPNVGGELLEKFGDLLVNSIVEKINNSGLLSHGIRDLLINDITSTFDNHQ